MAGRRVVPFFTNDGRATALGGEYVGAAPTFPESPATPTDAVSVTVRSILRNADKYALNTWYPATFGAQGTIDTLTLAGMTEDHVRPTGASALGLAVSISTGAYDATTTGVSLADAKTIATRLIRSLTAAHRATHTTATYWGYSWQSALWAGCVGMAGWLLWSDLTTADRAALCKMIGREADYRTVMLPEFWRNAAGADVYGRTGNTAAEENSWNVAVPFLAAAMIPAHRNRPGWLQAGIRLGVTAFSAPEDVNSATVVNGSTLSSYVTKGYNTNNDGTLVNANIIHPDYIATAFQNLIPALFLGLAGMDTPSGLRHGVDRAHSALTDVEFATPTYDEPGGTMYVTASAETYYPEGSTWGSARKMDKVAFDVMVTALDVVDASAWATLHANAAAAMQARFETGKTYDTGEDSYAGREQWVHYLAAYAWMSKWAVANGLVTWSDGHPGSF